MASPLANIEPTPRVKLALQLYTTGLAKTKKQASAMAGLHPNYLTMLTGPNGSVPAKMLQNDIERRLMDRTTEIAPIVSELGRKALAKLNDLMDSGKQEVQLRAAIDLADRSPETSKTQKLDITSLSLSGQDARELAKALVESARSQERFAHIAVEGLEEVVLVEPTLEDPTNEVPESKPER